jgi:hypothetical protein
MLTRVIRETRQLFPAEAISANYCWTFEVHQVHIAARADGMSLALLVENNAGIQFVRIEEILQGFLEMPEV